MSTHQTKTEHDNIAIQASEGSATEVEVRAAEAQELPWVRPELDVFESDSELLLRADMPGVSKEAISLTIEPGQLTLEGRWTHEDHKEAVFTELTAKHYRRVLKLPNGLDLDHVSAKLGDGVLEVHLPYAASLKPRQIEVQGLN